MTTRRLRDTDDRLELYPLDRYKLLAVTGGNQQHAEKLAERWNGVAVFEERSGVWFVYQRRLDGTRDE